MSNRHNSDDWLTPLVVAWLKMITAVVIAIVGGVVGIFQFQKQRQEHLQRADLLAPETPPKDWKGWMTGQKLPIQVLTGVGILFVILGLSTLSSYALTAYFIPMMVVAAIILFVVAKTSNKGTPANTQPVAPEKPTPNTAVVVVEKVPIPPATENAPIPLSVLPILEKILTPVITPSVPEKPSTLPSVTQAFTIRLPKLSEWEPVRALHGIEQILYAFDLLAFQIVADHESIRWQIVDLLGRKPEAIEQTLRAQFPAAEITIGPLDDPTPKEPFYRYVMLYRQVDQFIMPMNYITDMKAHDPLESVTQFMNALQPGERLVYSLVVVGYAEGVYAEGHKMITQSTINPLQYLTASGITDAAIKKFTQQDRIEKYVPELQRLFEGKLSQRLYQAMFCIQVDALTEERVAQLTLIHSATDQFTRYPFNGLRVPRLNGSDIIRVQTSDYDKETDALGRFVAINRRREYETLRNTVRLILEPREIAALWHLPHEQLTASRIAWLSGAQVPLPAMIATAPEGIVLGIGKYQGKPIEIKLSEADRRLHTNIVGKTGMGKSTLMHHLIHQDIAHGEGVAVVDPHGTLVRDILRISIPPERESDVVILDLANSQHPPPLNLLRGHASQVGQGKVLSVIEKLFVGTDQLARLSKYLRASLGLLQGDSSATMRDITRVFIDTAYRHNLLDAVDDPLTQDVWDGFEMLSSGQQEQIRDPLVSRIAPFYGNAALYPILCHPDTIDFTQLIQQRKIILISLKMDETQVAEQERNLIGALVISLLQMSGMGNVGKPYYIYIDEVQRFVTSSLPELFSEARKFGLSLIVAHQFLEQLKGETLQAVLGTVNTTIAFRCGVNDARVLSPYMSPHFRSEQLMNLDQYQAAVSLQYNGTMQDSFSLWTLPPLVTPENGSEREQALRERSVAAYTPRPGDDVRTWLKQRYPRLKRPNTAAGNDADDFYG